ncbi:MAG: hypothetical protein PHN57_02980, partial [Candidatus Omnitrophica bacterium]|nr:hypothetical protein [Candidatus Omnitrophota bacterium]
MLPKGVIFTTSTKQIIPDKTIKLMKKYHHLIEGIAITVANLDNERNELIEPGCPTAGERLEHMRRLKDIGCFTAGRMDPLFPLIDDTEDNLQSTIKEIAAAGAGHITGTYLFTFGRQLKELRKIPRLKDSLKLIKEKTYPIGGAAFSVSLEQKKKTYGKMNQICRSYGIKFNTCGCKDIVLRDTGYSLICRNIDYYNKEGI